MSTDREAGERAGDWLPGEALSGPATVLQMIVVLLGLAGLLTGLVLFVTGVPGPHVFQWSRAIGWGIAGLIISDAVLSPLALVLGVVVLRRLPRRHRPVARAAFLGLISLLIVVLIMAGSRARQQNPTAVPNDPWVGVAVGGSMIMLVVVAWEVVLLLRRRATRR